MPIIASCVAYQQVILAEDKITPQMRPVVQKMIERLQRHDTKVSYQYESLVYHFMVENEIKYLCVSDKTYQGRTVFGFLAEVRDRFRDQFAGSDKKYPSPEGLNQKNCARFSTQLASSAKTFNDNPEADKIGKIKEQIDNVKQIMLENLDSIIERGERIDNICDKTEMLKEEAKGFQNNARRLKQKMMCRNIKIAIALFAVLAVLGLVISFLVCGINFSKCKTASPAPAQTQAPPTPIPLKTS
jgi:vesicle-associated membrane protein 7